MNEMIIVKLGACAGLGTEAAGVLAELATGSSCFEGRLVNGVWATLAALEWLPLDASGHERRRALLEHALRDLVDQIDLRALGRVVLIMVVDEALQAQRRELGELIELVRAFVGPCEFTTVEHGRAGWFAGLERAREWLLEGRCDAALVAVSDTRCDRRSLVDLAAAGELLDDDNRDGLIAGEGACVALLCRPESALVRTSTLTRCLAVGLELEPRPFAGSLPNLAHGLTSLFATLDAGLPAAERFDVVVDALPGPLRFTKEFHAAYLRQVARMPEPLRRSSTAPSFGDAGMAAAGLALVVTERALSEGGRALIYAGDDHGRLGGAVVSRAPGPGPLEQRLVQLWSSAAVRASAASAHHGRPEVIDDHLEECGYRQLDRIDDLGGIQVPWFELDRTELAIQAEFDALTLAGDRAIERALAALDGSGDDARQGAFLLLGSGLAPTEVHASLLAAVAELDAEALTCFGRALELAPASPPTLLAALMQHEQASLRTLGLDLAAARLDVDEARVVEQLGDPEPSVREAASMSLARRGAHAQLPRILELAEREPERAGHPAALVWLGHARALDRLRWLVSRHAESSAAAAVFLALSGELEDLRLIAEAARALPPSVALIDALGIAGLPASVADLLALLPGRDHEDPLADAAARALERISGAALRETIEDEAGELERRRCRDPQRWRAWFDEHGRWPADLRVRGGRPFELRCCWDELSAGAGELALRRLAAEELALRGPVRVHFVASASVEQQREVLARWAASLGSAV
jgi:hypothetical protein